ncbi:hypothetical protein BC629DRAFT_78834 [Irpex lacteus]|nr:hypothetical protein BC629DRAFT_78834 [Irpex lacteus]
MGEQVGRIIVIPDVAHTTLKAMIHFLYFGTLNFAPVTSAGKGPQRSQLPGESIHASTIRSHPWDAPRCSPKSMYRLADKFGLTELKAKAKESMKLNMTTDNITTELRSSITSTYDEIRDMMIQFACERSRLPLVIAMIPEWLEELATGRIPRAASTLAALIQKVTTLPPPTVIHHLPCSVCRNPLNMDKSQCYCHHCKSWQSPEASTA